AIGLSVKLDGGDSSIDKIFQGISRDSLLLLPLLVSALGIFASIIGKFIVSTNEESKIGRALFSGLVLASIVVIVGSFLIVQSLEMPLGIFYALISGLILGVMIGKITERYTSMDTPSVLEIAKQAETGPATVVIHGMAVGMQSTMLPTLLICFSIGLSYYFAGLYGIAIAAVGMLSTLGISLGVDAYGPVADNAGGIAEMAGLPKETRARTDALDAAGNTTAAIGKGFAIGSAALTALALFSTYSTQGNLKSIDILDPMVTIGLLIGSALVFLFCSLSMSAVGRAAGRMVEEVRHQFKTIPGLMEGKAEPDSKRCVAISTAAALREMILPGVLAVASPLLCGYFLGKAALGGLLAGSLVTGVMMAIFMSNAGGAWDNAKKQIEKRDSSHPHAKGSNTYKAAVVGDTIGDPFKDTAGPSLNILVKLMSIVALVFLPLFTS
ncbi:MAG: sodium-translocating pyrophosphatase, partial [Planctomycetota bacterium]